MITCGFAHSAPHRNRLTLSARCVLSFSLSLPDSQRVFRSVTLGGFLYCLSKSRYESEYRSPRTAARTGFSQEGLQQSQDWCIYLFFTIGSKENRLSPIVNTFGCVCTHLFTLIVYPSSFNHTVINPIKPVLDILAKLFAKL